MDGTNVISVSRAVRPREVLLRRVMAVLAVVFLLQAIMFSTGFMLPCFLMTLCYFWFSHASKREYEYTLADGVLKIERVSDRGRRVLHEIPFAAVMALCPALNYSRTGMAALANMKDVPLFIAQAERDETIPVSVGRQAAEELEKAGGNVTLKVFTDAEMEAAGAVHGQEQTYSFHHAELALLENEDYAEWLFSFKRK